MKKKWSLTTKLTLSYTAIIVFILSLTLAFLIQLQSQNINNIVDATISSLSASLAADPVIIQAVEDNQVSAETSDYLDNLIEQRDYVDYIVLVNAKDTRLYHIDRERIGKAFEGGDEAQALAGGVPYITEGRGSREFQRRSFHPIYGEDQSVIGFIMVSSYTRSIALLKQQEISKYLIIFVIAMLIGLLFAFIIARSVRKTLLGYEPTQISQMFLQREEVLGTLTEGLLLVNLEGECEYINPSARRLFHLAGSNTVTAPSSGIVSNDHPENADTQIQQFITDHILPDLTSSEPVYRKQVQLSSATLLMDKIPISDKKHLIGNLILLNDKTETTKMAEELTGVNHIIAALRATTHEHKNKLHVILGLLQTGETAEAMKYINNCSSEEDDNSQILNCIHNKTIAALILGKKNRAKELNITFNLLKDSYLEAHNDFLPASDLVTIIGNLVENAFDALKNIEDTREVNLFIKSAQDALMIIVDDTGTGMDADTIQTLLHKSYTSKGEGHGVGLTLIRNIVERCNGILDIDSEPGEGSSFSVTINQKRIRYPQED